MSAKNLANAIDEAKKAPEVIQQPTNKKGSFEESIEASIAEEKTNESKTRKPRGNVKNNEKKKAAETVMIKAVSRVATQLNDVWYSFEFSETRQINDDSNIEEERQKLWDTVNVQVDDQAAYVIESLKNPNGIQQG